MKIFKIFFEKQLQYGVLVFKATELKKATQCNITGQVEMMEINHFVPTKYIQNVIANFWKHAIDTYSDASVCFWLSSLYLPKTFFCFLLPMVTTFFQWWWKIDEFVQIYSQVMSDSVWNKGFAINQHEFVVVALDS